MNGFFEEVKRRKVYRVAVAYVIAAGGIIQLASASFAAFGDRIVADWVSDRADFGLGVRHYIAGS